MYLVKVTWSHFESVLSGSEFFFFVELMHVYTLQGFSMDIMFEQFMTYSIYPGGLWSK